MTVLDFNKPIKIRSSKEHAREFSSDSGVAGTYVPNMSTEDTMKWKGKHIKGKQERVEIRKTFGGQQLLIIVRKSALSGGKNRWDYEGNVRMSSNGRIHMSFGEWQQLTEAVDEAKELIGILK